MECTYLHADLLMVAGAILIGYASCILQQGFGSSGFSKMVCSSTLYSLLSVCFNPTVCQCFSSCVFILYCYK